MSMTNKRIVLTISAVLILAICVAGISVYSQSKYESGYEDGRNVGYDEGRKDGYYDGLKGLTAKDRAIWDYSNKAKYASQGFTEEEIDRVYRNSKFQEAFGNDPNFEELKKLSPEERDSYYNAHIDSKIRSSRTPNKMPQENRNRIIPYAPKEESPTTEVKLKGLKGLTAKDRRLWDQANKVKYLSQGATEEDLERLYRNSKFKEAFGNDPNFEDLKKLSPEERDNYYNAHIDSITAYH